MGLQLSSRDSFLDVFAACNRALWSAVGRRGIKSDSYLAASSGDVHA
jgi:hypothetical protein